MCIRDSSSAVSIPNGLNFDSNTFVIDATNNRVGLGTASPLYTLDVTRGNIAGVQPVGRFGVSGNGGSGRGASILISSGGSASSVDVAQIVGYQNAASATANSAALAFQVANSSGTLTEYMYINNSGNVGIGTNSPASYSNFIYQTISGTNGSGLRLQNAGSTVAAETAVSSSGYFMAAVTAHPIILSTTNIERMRISSTGNVGIATSSPNFRLSFGETTALKQTAIYMQPISLAGADNEQRISNGNTASIYSSVVLGFNNLGAGIADASYVAFRTFQGANNVIQSSGEYGVERMRITNAGNVGIGTSSPSNRLVVNGSTGTTQIQLSDSTASNNLVLGVNATTVDINAVNGFPMVLYTSNTERMRITNAGNVGIGTSSPAAKLEVLLTSGTDPSLRLRYNSSSIYGNHLMNGGGDYVIESPASNGVTSGNMRIRAGSGFSVSTNNQAATSPQLILDSSGNLGLGVTPATWASGWKAIQVGATGSISENNAGDVYFGSNWALTTTGDKYLTTNFANVYAQINGQHQWFNAPSGTAGGTPTFTQAMTLDASGNFIVGETTTTGFWPANVTQTAARSLISYTDATTNLDNANAGLVILNRSTTANSSTKLVFGAFNSDPVPVGMAYISATNASRSTGYLASSLVFGTSSGIGAGAVERMRIDSSGNMGLGVTPSAWGSGWTALQIRDGGPSIWSDGGDRSFFSTNTYFNGTNRIYTTSGPALEYVQDSGGHSWKVAPSGTAGNAITFTQAMTLDSSGNLLVGGTTAYGTFSLYGSMGTQCGFTSNSSLPAVGTSTVAGEIRGFGSSGATADNGFLRLSAGGGTGSYKSFIDLTGYFNDSAITNIIRFGTGNTERMRIDSSGNVGIGTSSPTDGRLHLNGGTTTNIKFTNVGTGTTASDGFFVGLGSSTDTVAYVYQRENSEMVFGTNNLERMRIDSSGNLLVGTTASLGLGSEKLSVYITGAGNSAVAFSNNAGGDQWTQFLWNRATSGNNLFLAFGTEGSYTSRGGILYNRGTGQINYNVTSDQRLKENIVDASSALSKVNSIKIRSYNWKETGNHVDFGVIAQELIDVAPEAVSEGQDNPDGTIKNPWGVDTSTLVPSLIKAIQEQQAIINDLKARIETLESK